MGLDLRQSFELKADPRLEVNPADFQEQQNLLVAIECTIKDIHQSVQQMQDVKAQVEQLNGTLKRNTAVEDLITVGKGVVTQIDEWEKQLIQSEHTNLHDAISFPNQLSAELISLLLKVDTHEPFVTSGAKVRYKDLQAQWQAMKKDLDDIINGDLAEYNRLYREKDIPAVIVPMTSRPRPRK